MAQLECSDLCLGYDGREIVHNLSFTVNGGDYLCIVGENGSGKSTLMRTVLGLQQPLSGRIELSGGLSKNEIGYLPQQTQVQKDFPATVYEVVISGCQGRRGLRPFYSKEDKTLAKKNIEKMGISHLEKRCYRQLSGGQQQRVLLARALCAAGRILLLDEPVSGLDPAVTAEMYRTIEALNKEGITVIMISHDMGAALKYASHILHIGENTFFGTKEEYIKSGVSADFLMKGGEGE